MRPARWSARASCALFFVLGDAIAARAASPARTDSAVCIPVRTENRTIRVRAQIGVRDSIWIAVDTGASGSLLDGARAAALGLEIKGSSMSHGAGGAQEGSVAHDVDLRLPGFELLDQALPTLSLDGISSRSGLPLEGVLGYELFSQRVVEVDYARGCMRLHDPKRFEYRGSGAILPLEFKQDHPYVTARVVLADGRAITGKFEIDTGNSGLLILASETVASERVLESMPRSIAAGGRGVGGATESRLGRVARLELGPFKLEAPLAALQTPGAGRISAPGTAGNIGGGILSRFKVIFDYPRKRMILEPNASLGDPFEADMSGLMLTSAAPELRSVKVARVQDGSPASEAGVQPGDEIRRVDGTPVEEIGIPALREMLRREGREIRIELLRGGEPLEVTLRTRRLI